MTLAQEARFALRLSRKEFAQLLGVSGRTLQAWEQGTREPTGAATTLLQLLTAKPATCMRALLALGIQSNEGPGRIERAWSQIWREYFELRDEELERQEADVAEPPP